MSKTKQKVRFIMATEKKYVVNFGKFAETDENGALDDVATFAKFEDEYTAWKTANAANHEMIATAIADVFNELTAEGGRLSIQTASLVVRVLGKLGDKVPVSQTQKMTECIHDFIDTSSVYVTEKGKFGGVMRASDKAARVAEAEAREAAKAAKKAAKA
jgi:hypothetical protein